MGLFAGPPTNKTVKSFIENAQWNLKLFDDVDQKPSYSYLIGMAIADLERAEQLARDLDES